MGTITAMLVGQAPDNHHALANALPHVYNDLLRIANRYLQCEKWTPTFDADCLVHETYLRLVTHERTRWKNRRHLLAVSSRIMRRLLVDRARARQAIKRGAGDRLTTFEGKEIDAGRRRMDLLDLEDALTDLQRYDQELAQLVELRYFGGLSNNELAIQFGVTSMTIIRKWRLARAWLERYLNNKNA